MIYLDNSATTKPLDSVVLEMSKVMSESFGNPSSLHKLGIDSEEILKKSRKVVARTLSANPDEIVFNSGGTEGDNGILLGVARARKRYGNKIITSQVEHPAILESCKVLEAQGFEICKIGVDRSCHLDMEQLKAEINDNTILISLMAVNNEVGTITDLDAIDKIKGQALFHTDCVQGYGKLDFSNFKGDFLTASGHKIHGPKGIGFQFMRAGINIKPFITGGGQERNLRSGTENVPAIAGLAIACEHAFKSIKSNKEHIGNLKRSLLEGIWSEVKDIRVNSPWDSVNSILSISFMGIRGEVLLHILEEEGIYVSTGSACSSNKKGQSHVLKAMGLSDKEIEGTIRFSLSEFTTERDIEFTIEKVGDAVKRLRKLGSFR